MDLVRTKCVKPQKQFWWLAAGTQPVQQLYIKLINQIRIQVISVYVEVSRVVPDPEKSSMLWPLEVLPITERTGLIRKATFLSLFPSQPELHFQIPFISFSLTGRDRRAALKRSLQNWCPAACCTLTSFTFGGMVLSGSTGHRVDFRCQFTWWRRAEGCEEVTK